MNKAWRRTGTLAALLALGGAGLAAGTSAIMDLTGPALGSAPAPVPTRTEGILHPMPPLGDIDCCHLRGITAEDDWETPVSLVSRISVRR